MSTVKKNIIIAVLFVSVLITIENATGQNKLIDSLTIVDSTFYDFEPLKILNAQTQFTELKSLGIKNIDTNKIRCYTFGLESSAEKEVCLYIGNIEYADWRIINEKKDTLYVNGGYIAKGKEGMFLKIFFTAFEKKVFYLVCHNRIYNLKPLQIVVDDKDKIEERYFDGYAEDNIGWFLFQVGFVFVLIFQIISILLQWSFTQRKEYPYYIAFLSCIVFCAYQQLSEEYHLGWGYNYEAAYCHYYYKSVLALPSIFYLRFVRNVLDFNVQQPKQVALIRKVEFGMLGYVILNTLFTWVNFNEKILFFFYIVFHIAFVLIGFSLLISYVANRNDNVSRAILLGVICIAIGSVFSLILYILKDHLPDSLHHITFPFQIGILFEVLFFNYALAYKSKLIGKNRLALLHERDAIARHLHDDLKASLAAIANLSSIALINPDNTHKILNQLEIIAKRTFTRTGSLEKIIGRNTGFNQLLSEIHEESRILAESCKPRMELFFSFDEDVNNYLDATLKFHAYLVIKEAIQDAINHSKGTQLFVSFKSESSNLVINIKDNGVGFDPEQVEQHGIQNIKNSCLEMGAAFNLNTDIGKGTEINIKIPKNRDRFLKPNPAPLSLKTSFKKTLILLRWLRREFLIG